MRRQIRSELIKMTSTRTIYGLLIGALAVVALTTWSTIANGGGSNARGHLYTQQMFFLSSINLGLFAVIIGIRAITDEFRHGTVVPSVLTGGNRGRFLMAKAGVAASAAAVVTTLAQGMMAELATILTSSRGGSLEISSTDLGAMAGLTVSSAMWAVIGVGVGALIRHQVAAIVGALIWVLVVENLGAGLLGDAGLYLPGVAAHGLTGLPGYLTVSVAAAVLTAYAAAALAAGHLSTVRRDI